MAYNDLRWRSLIPGLLAAVAIAAAVMSILVFARVGALRGEKELLYAPTDAARGVMKGTPVWLEGRKVGVVRDIRFLTPRSDTSGRLLLVLDVLAEVRDHIREDSFAQIRTGGSLIGAPVVYVKSGSPGARVLDDGDTLRTRPQLDVEDMGSTVALATRDFPAIMENVKALGDQLAQRRGSAGALLGPEGSRQIEVARGNANALAHRLTTAQGTLGLALNGRGAVMARANKAMAGVDSLRALLGSEQSAVGRFRRDSTLLRTVASLRNELSITRALLDESRGTAGRGLNDRAVFTELSRLERELGLLMDDIKHRPLRYVIF